MKRARLWARVADDIKPLKEPSTIGRALTEEEKQRLLKTAVMRPEWETAYLAAILCLNTTARGCELKALQWSDVDLFARTLTIRTSKTAAGERVVPLTDVALSALARLRRRAESFGPVEPSHYIFAAFVPKFTFSGKKVIGYNVTAFDPTTHVKSWRSAWRTLTKKAGLAGFPVPRSPALRYHSACGERNIGFNDHGYCWARQQTYAGAVQPRSHGSEAQGDGSPCYKHQNGGL